MKRLLVFTTCLFSLQLGIGQGLYDLENKILVYEALFIEPNGDTLTNEKIEFHFTSASWLQKSQKEVKFKYFTDTVNIKKFIQPFEKVRKKYAKNQAKKDKKKRGWGNWTWLYKSETTGYKLNDTIFWMHPPRSNQYLYNEISGMPSINLQKLSKGETWSDELIIMMGWHDFKGTLVSSYEVLELTSYNYQNVKVPAVWEIEVVNTHSELGEHQSRILFDKDELGFLRFDNSFHDGRRIIMSLVDVKEQESSKM